MRCPSCGTENAPDSRFCGGCGARVASSGVRVAPTQKITDDASFPQPGVAPGRAAQVTPKGAPQAFAASHAAGSAINTTQQGVTPARPLTTPPPVSAVRPAHVNGGSSGAQRPASAPSPSPSPQVARTATPQRAQPERSMPIVAQRPWGLIIVVLILDIALAAAGAWMLMAGLSDPPAARSTSDAPASTGPGSTAR